MSKNLTKKSTVGTSRVFVPVALTGLILTVFLLTFDIVLDWKDQCDWWHIVIEMMAAAILLPMIGYLVINVLRAHQEVGFLHKVVDDNHNKISSLEEEITGWQREHTELTTGIRDEVEQQFELWKLSISEKEIGLLLLRGESLKAVAAIRKTGEATVRQQCSEIYRKSGLSGRSEFAGWFLSRIF